jgi:outer membrane beta-barrel protein
MVLISKIYKSKTKLFLPLFFVILSPTFSFAQEEELESDLDVIEAEIQTAKPAKRDQRAVKEDKEVPDDFSALGRLSPFSEIAVIQKRFLPKTNRFQFFAGLASVMNDPWFNGIGFNTKFAFNIREAWGVELTGIFLNNSQRDSIKELNSQNNISTGSFIATKSYFGLDVLWIPIYGKMSLSNSRIVPFDFYFSGGGGSTSVEQGTGGSTFHLGTGQIFALSKYSAVRWDFSWNSYSGKPDAAGFQPSTFNNLILSLGLSFFFPGAGYR